MFKLLTNNCGLKLLAGLLALVLFSYVHLDSGQQEAVTNWPAQLLSASSAAALKVPVVVSGLAPGMSCELDPTELVLDSPELNVLSDEQRKDISARLDLTGLTAGSYRIRPQLKLPAGTPELEIEAPAVRVTIIAAEKAAS